ncbi:MAG: 3-deoxy-8-phosphooctulonate synthase [Holosporaceae bacterium]
MSNVSLGRLTVGNALPFALIAGPCMMENEALVLDVAEKLSEITQRLSIPFIFKSSFDKANRTSVKSARGIGLEKGLRLFEKVKQRFGCPVLTDVHTPDQCAKVADVVDVLQIPAFLCRQTDLLKAAAETGRVLNIKKGQFLAPWDMKGVVEKVKAFGGQKVFVCERGASFGYNTLVSDFRALSIMKGLNVPVIFDATHSVQQPGGLGDASGGQRIFVETLARAAMAIGVAGLFLETHPDPDQALSDGPNMVPLAHMESFLRTLQTFDQVAKEQPYQPFSVAASG